MNPWDKDSRIHAWDSKKQKYNLECIDVCIVVLAFAVCLFCAIETDPLFCPDESGRQLLSDWIYQNGKLPHGNEPEIIIGGWGFSYALRPYVTAILAAAFKKAVSLFSESETALLVASRMPSVLSVAFTGVYCLKIGNNICRNKWTARVMAVMVCFLPQTVFLGSYQNNDALSLLSVSAMVYYYILGMERHWDSWCCIKLALSISIAALSYYSVFGWILMIVVFCLISCLMDDMIINKWRFVLKRIALATVIVLFAAGWFYIRNAYLYNGDALGMQSERIMRDAALGRGMQLYPYQPFREKGKSMLALFSLEEGFLSQTLQSFLGKFGYMNIPMEQNMYFMYGLFILTGTALYLATLHLQKPNKTNWLIDVMMLGACIMTFALHVYQSYYRDYQPQGRYVITLILFFAFMLTTGIERLGEFMKTRGYVKSERTVSIIAICTWLILFIIAYSQTMSKMWYH